jgi:hypothetical protein
MSAIEFVRNDGGRTAAGYRGDAGDCVTRAIAIATEQPYRDVYAVLHGFNKTLVRSGGSPRNGVSRRVWDAYLKTVVGWQWTPTMQIGSGCRVHLRADELPPGRLIVRLSGHLAAVIDGVLHDTHDCSRNGTRCVYGFWSEP